MSEHIIRTDALRVGYDSKVVVDNVDINALRGHMVCLLGPNGAGKSTILRTVSGLLAPVEGTVFIDGSDIRNQKKSSLAKKLAVVLTEKLSPGFMTVFEIAAMGRHPYTGFFGRLTNEDRDIVRQALAAVHAEHLSDRYYQELSDGERQKVMIARALAQQPELIVLDEPTSHLDVKHRVEVISILSRLCKQKKITVLLSLHDIDLAIKGCEIVLLMRDGHIVAHGAPSEIVKQGTIQKLYDIQGARYDDLLGSIEIGGGSRPDLFIIGGAGSAIPAMRTLARVGYGMSAGVLHENDVDAYVAQATCGSVVCENSFEPVSDAAFEAACQAIGRAAVVLEAGFPIGAMNARNMDLVRYALRRRKPVFSLRNPADAEHLYQEAARTMVFSESVGALIAAVEMIVHPQEVPVMSAPLQEGSDTI